MQTPTAPALPPKRRASNQRVKAALTNHSAPQEKLRSIRRLKQ